MNLEFRVKVLPGDRNVVYVNVRWYLKQLDKMKPLRESVQTKERERRNWKMEYSPSDREGAGSVAGRKKIKKKRSSFPENR